MLSGRVGAGRCAHAAHFHIALFVRPFRHFVKGQIGKGCEHEVELGGNAALQFLILGNDRFERGHFFLQGIGGGFVLAAHGLPDFLGSRIAAALGVLQFLHAIAAGLVEGEDFWRLRGHAAAGEGNVEALRILSYRFDVMHDFASLAALGG